ncbi:hypothetical protein ACFSL4_07595 [Streptomyces caeni]|uniref:Uncharacterized protein n=1 Tax=Streptomyces caeni TaxID=2307231 RepID=A0ABW4IMI3_9ACTN
MPSDPYAALHALVLAEAVRTTKPNPERDPEPGEEPLPPAAPEQEHD